MSTAVLAMAYGTPRSREDVAAFYTDIRRGRPPSTDELATLVARYEAIGGLSPLTERSAAQVAALQSALDDLTPGQFRVFYATKHAAPSIESCLEEIARQGYQNVVALVLAPHFSELSVGEYLARARASATTNGLVLSPIKQWHELPALIEQLTVRVQRSLGQMSSGATQTTVVFSAHSLPERIRAGGDPYIDQLTRTAELVARRAGLSRYRVGWQSASRTHEKWLGPDISEVLAEEAASSTAGVLVCPAGFTSDHLEVLYDLDVVAATIAHSLGLEFARTDSLNDDPAIARGLAELVQASAAPR